MKCQLLCLQKNHQERTIQGACKNKNCKIKRFCAQCQNEQHKEHINDLLPFEKLILYEKDRKELAERIISKSTYITQSLNELIELEKQLNNNNKSIFDMNGFSFEEYINLLLKAEEFDLKLVQLLDEFQKKLDSLKNGDVISEAKLPTLLPSLDELQQQEQQQPQVEISNQNFPFLEDQQANKFFFSKIMKGEDVMIGEGHRIYISDEQYQFALLLPKLNPLAINKLKITITGKIGFDLTRQTEVGVCCSLDHMQKKNFKVRALEPNNKCYLVQDLGTVSKNGKQTQSFGQITYHVNDILILQADLQNKILSLYNESRGGHQVIDLDVDQSNINDWYFCVQSSTYKIEILDS